MATKKYYAVGEKVYVKPLKEFGIIESLDIQPKTEDGKGIYEANVKVGEDVGTYKLWELDKIREDKKVEKVEYKTNNPHREHRKDTIFFAKTHPEAKVPSKIDENAGWDIYPCFDEESIVLQPGEIKLIPTGISSAFSNKYYFNLKHERGSTGMIGLATLSGVVDSGYRGEWFVALQNTNSIPISITKEVTEKVITEDFIELPYNRAICQATLDIVPSVNAKTIPYEELLKFSSERGTGKLGSSEK